MRYHNLLTSYSLPLILSASLVSCNCKKEDPTPPPAEEATLVGRWELTRTTGGLAGGVRLADPNRKEEIIFSAAGQASFLLNGTITRTPSYSLVQGMTYTTRQPKTFVRYNANTSLLTYIEQLSTTNLTLVADVADGTTSEYIKR